MSNGGDGGTGVVREIVLLVLFVALVIVGIAVTPELRDALVGTPPGAHTADGGTSTTEAE